ncbi:hypothetical protein R5R35_006277 [Gryllus longicercus]|uniref:Uncharacterized protein n=1 Tax=Gryllus longicercus TaxID=2509291 RepID=A0AAN9W122_9ORTH
MTISILHYISLLFFVHIKVFGYNVDTNFPLIYEDPFRNPFGRSSYFGYSVLLSKTWIQIGAPRGNFSTEGMKIIEPGVVYHCKFGEPWVQLSLGKSLSKQGFSISRESWFGIAMDFEPGITGKIVVCGHRWMNVSFPKDIPGACYSFQSNDDLTRISNILTPTSSTNKDKRFYYQDSSKPSAYKYALSQSGISVHFSRSDKTGNQLLLGAPGFLNWKGSVVKCENVKTCSKQPTVINTYHNKEINDFDLFGYQVSSGHFFSHDDVWYVAGAPRDLTMKGYVIIYKFPKHESKIEKLLKVTGKTTGEYFGSSIAVADITNDGLDDLIVGAPFFSQNGDEGRIYILEFHKDKKLKKMEHIEGKAEMGRFGTAVASVGDLDHDGFADIAVGAPYEGNGVVYIYYGRSTGLKGPHQRIPAEDLYKNLRGFGISFSGQITTAGNYYNGIAVGSFLSGHAVILRTLPVVTVSTHIKPVTRQLSHAVSQAIVDVCVHFSGTNVSRLNITRRISADRSFGRAKPAYIHDTLLLDVNEEKCQNYTFHVLFKPDLVHQSMVFLLSAQVTNTSEAAKRKDILYVQEDGSISGYDGFQFQDPIQKISSGSSETTLEIPYSQDCKNDVCEPDLQLKCYILQNGNKFNLTQTFVIGSKAKYQLQIDVTNSGEPSYTTLAEIKFSKEIQLASIPYMCTEIDEATSCQLGIIKKSNNRNIILDLDMSSVDELNTDEDRALYITVNVSTAAKDKNLVNNFQQLNLNLSLDVDAHIYGKSQKDNYAVSKFDNGSFASVLEIAQIFEIHKKGDSPLNTLEMTMKVPVNVINGKQEIQVISFHKPDGIIDNKYWDCNADFGCTNCQNVFQREFEVPESAVSENVRIKRSFPEEILIDKEKAPPSNRTLYINCSSEYTNCTSVRCQTTDLEDYGKVTLRLKVDIAKLGPFMGQKDIIYITSEGEVKILYPDITSVKNIQQKWSHVAKASSQIIGKIPKKKVDLWIIIASIIGGILIAMVVAMGLAKAGFFQRKTKTELEQLKERSRNSQMPAQQMSVLDADLDTNGTELN